MKVGKIKVDTLGAQTLVIPEVDKTPKSDICLERTIKYKCNKRSSTKRVNYVKTSKKGPKMFPVEATEKIKPL